MMLKYIEDGRGNIQLVKVPGHEDIDALTEIIRVMQEIDHAEIIKALRLDLSELPAPPA